MDIKTQMLTNLGNDYQLLQDNITNSTVDQLKSFINTLSTVVQSFQQDLSKLSSNINEFNTFFVKVANLLCERNQADIGINLICDAIDLLQKSTPNSMLTSLHAPLLQLCLKSKNLKLALKHLDVAICQSETELGDISVKSYLSFHYYGGLIYALLKQYDNSLYFLEQAITIPAVSVSQVMVEAYKKFMLISLAYKGKVAKLPEYTSTVMLAYVKQSMKCYFELAEAFEEYNILKVEQVCFQNENTFQQDKNLGLIKQLKACITKKKILQLTKAFSTVPLSDIIDRAQLSCTLPELEDIITKMIKEKEINGNIDQENKMMIFQDEPDSNEETEDQIKTLVSMNSQMENTNIQFVLNKLKKQKATRSSMY